ncbi:MAG: serine/threonine-protein kinase [Candidatus Micrarchaeota archaeon]
MHRNPRRPRHRHQEPVGRDLFDIIDRRYQPLKEIGCGAVAIVHLAKDEQTGSNVALKRIRGDKLGNRNAHYTLKTEARALSLVRHGGVPCIFDSKLTGPDPYIVEEFKDGLTFSLNNLNESRRIIELTIRVCDILSTLHSAGIVHRDVKPSNLVLSMDKSAVSLLDYGYSIVPGMQDFAMRVDIAVGTPMFMAPEQTYPRAFIDRRADIYSLGMIIYQFLSRWYPYVTFADRDETEEYFRVHRSASAVPLHMRNPSIPKRLSYAVARALEKEPHKRYQDAEDFADALSGCLAHALDIY